MSTVGNKANVRLRSLCLFILNHSFEEILNKYTELIEFMESCHNAGRKNISYRNVKLDLVCI